MQKEKKKRSGQKKKKICVGWGLICSNGICSMMYTHKQILHSRLLCVFSSQKTNVREPTTSLISEKKEPTQLYISWNTVESNCLHLHTNVTFYLSRDWGRFYPLHRDALDKTFFPPLWDKLVMQSEKVKGNSMHFAPGAFFLYSFSFTRHWYAVICVSRLEYIGFVSISLKDEAVCWVKRHSGCPS